MGDDDRWWWWRKRCWLVVATTLVAVADRWVRRSWPEARERFWNAVKQYFQWTVRIIFTCCQTTVDILSVAESFAILKGVDVATPPRTSPSGAFVAGFVSMLRPEAGGNDVERGTLDDDAERTKVMLGARVVGIVIWNAMEVIFVPSLSMWFRLGVVVGAILVVWSVVNEKFLRLNCRGCLAKLWNDKRRGDAVRLLIIFYLLPEWYIADRLSKALRVMENPSCCDHLLCWFPWIFFFALEIATIYTFRPDAHLDWRTGFQTFFAYRRLFFSCVVLATILAPLLCTWIRRREICMTIKKFFRTSLTQLYSAISHKFRRSPSDTLPPTDPPPTAPPLDDPSAA